MKKLPNLIRSFWILILLILISGQLSAQNQLNQKLMMGYQGWFLCQGDQSAPNEWRHWFKSTTNPSAANLNIDMWPDMSEYTQTYATSMTYQNGSTARLFSSHDQSTTMVHFKWMKDYNVYGVYLQRFLGEAVNDPRFFQVRNHVLENVMAASQTHGRKYAIMYDISGVPDDGNLFTKIKNDWEYLVNTYNMTQTNEYVKQEGKPVIAIWGIGFNQRGLNPATFTQIIDYFHSTAAPQYRAYVVGGVPGQWRTLDGDSETNAAWTSVYHSLDMISPWTVGRYTTNTEADNWKNNRIIPDLADCNSHGVDYMPVIFPGFSWRNLQNGQSPLNQIPRNGGNFYWRQAYNALDAGADFIYVAMFDEVDEATAMFKLAKTAQDQPTQGSYVPLNADGVELPSDWYLRLADETQKMLDNTIPLSSQITISPNDPTPGTLPPNPFIRNIYTADPSAHVWADGRLYVYPSHDIAPPQGADLMDQYHVFSTDDMVNWVDHGEILRASQVPWGRPEGGFMWAPDCAYKNGTYYFYFPHPSETSWNNSWKIGVATSSSPASGFTVQGYIPGLESLIDPCVFVDDDGQAYFYYGGGGVCKGGKLKANMMEIDGAMQNMTGLVDFHEATWVHKRNGLYYLSYSDNHDSGGLHNRMRYATSPSPLGPWTHGGIYMDPTDSYTNHGSIVEYEGQWYSFYHNSALSGNDWLRSICVDKLFYNADGTIQKVIQTKAHGTPYGGTPWTIPGTIQAENFDVGGQTVSYSDSDTQNLGGQYRTNEAVDIGVCSEGGHNVGWVNGSEWLEYTVNVTNPGTYTLTLRVATESATGANARVFFNGEDKTGQMSIPNTGNWQVFTNVTAQVSLSAGQQVMQLRMGDGAFNINHIALSGGQTNQPPTANAGADKNLVAGTTSTSFTGSGSDPENSPLTYTWTKISGPNATIASPNSATTSISGLTNGSSYVFRLTVSDGSLSATDDVSVTVASPVSQSPYPGSPWAIPGTIEVESFDIGGEGVAYHDNEAANQGGQFRTTEGVDVEVCSAGGFNVGWTNAGEWLEYTVNVASAGTYNFEFRVASTLAGGTFHVEFNGVNKTGTVTSVNTGAWQTWQSVFANNIALSAGVQIMRIALDNPNHNLDKVIITSFGGNIPVTGVSVSPTSASINVGATQQLTRTIAPANASNQNVTWSSNNTSVATVNSSGLVTGVAAGTATITVTTQDGNFTATSAITVTSGGGSLPSPWASSNVGTVGQTGSASHSGGTFTAAGSGADIWGTADGFRYIYQQVSGDMTVTARVVSMTNTDGWAKAGVMMRNALTANSQHAFTAVTISNGLAVQRRVTSGGESSSTGGGAGSAPYWVRLQRSGSTFTSFVSSNGTSWTQVGSASITMGTSIYVGLAVTSHNNSALCTATFDNVSVTTGGNVPVTGVSVSPTSASIAVGATQQLTRTIAPANATNQNVTLSSNNTSVATVNSSGLVTGVAAGSATITVTTQDGNFTATSAITVTGGGSGPTQYRIRNVWQNTYMYDAGDQVRYNATASGNTYLWVLEDVGGGFVELKNVGTGEYMHIENLLGYVQCTSRTFGWYSSRWAVEDAGNGERRLRNAWQSTQYQHVENLQNQIQHGTINTTWASAKWVLEPVGGSRLGEDELEAVSNALLIYPNPLAGDKVTVKFDGELNENSAIRLYDLAGMLLLTRRVEGSRTELFRGDLKSGVYLLQFHSVNGVETRRLVIK